MTNACLGCNAPYNVHRITTGWWHFDRYTGGPGVNGVDVNGVKLTLTGSACPKCSATIYTPEGYREAVLKQAVTRKLTA